MKRRSNMAPQRYAPTRTGVLAVDPSAFMELFIVPSSRESELIGDVCVVDICGPLEQHDVGWSDSYEAIRARVAEACTSPAKAIMLRVDSPGGACAGCFDAARAIRAMCAAARKPLYAYCDHATSAGYALASAAQAIGASDTAMIGSIGVIETRHDFSAQNAAQGVRVEFIASGARKVDGRVDAPITDAEIASKRRNVDAVAGLFFALVQETRGIAATKVAALEADVFHAEAARELGLIDDVTTFESMLARVASGERIAMATPYEDARAALEKAAKGDDHNAAAAKRALAAMDEGMSGGDDDAPADDADKPKPKPDADKDAAGDDDDKDAAGDDDDKQAAEGGDDDDKQAAEGGDDDATPPAKKPAAAGAGAGAAASTRSVALEALAKAHQLGAELRETRDRDERLRLLNTRKDFSRELRTELLRVSTPLATVRSMVKNLKRGMVTETNPPRVVATTAAPTRGAGQGDQIAGSAPLSAEAIDMDLRMGLIDTTLGVTKNRNTLMFGVVHKPQAAPVAPVAAGARGSK